MARSKARAEAEPVTKKEAIRRLHRSLWIALSLFFLGVIMYALPSALATLGAMLGIPALSSGIALSVLGMVRVLGFFGALIVISRYPRAISAWREAKEVIVSDSCWNCGYILQGLPARGRGEDLVQCPECGDLCLINEAELPEPPFEHFESERVLAQAALERAEKRWFFAGKTVPFVDAIVMGGFGVFLVFLFFRGGFSGTGLLRIDPIFSGWLPAILVGIGLFGWLLWTDLRSKRRAVRQTMLKELLARSNAPTPPD